MYTMQLNIAPGKTISEVQQDFNGQYPFLKLEFYKMSDADNSFIIKKHLLHSAQLKEAGLKKNGTLEIKDKMTVEELEKAFLQQFGLLAQVSRKSGIVWLETTMTDKWSLAKQNDHGREITLNVKNPPADEIGEDIKF